MGYAAVAVDRVLAQSVGTEQLYELLDQFDENDAATNADDVIDLSTPPPKTWDVSLVSLSPRAMTPSTSTTTLTSKSTPLSTTTVRSPLAPDESPSAMWALKKLSSEQQAASTVLKSAHLDDNDNDDDTNDNNFVASSWVRELNQADADQTQPPSPTYNNDDDNVITIL